MQGKISMRFNMPNVQRFRSRVENPSKELTSEIREMLADVVSEVLNGQQLTIRAKMIERIDAMNLTYKSPAHEAKVKSVVEPFFDAIFASSVEKLNAITGTVEDEGNPGEADDKEADTTESESDEFEE